MNGHDIHDTEEDDNGSAEPLRSLRLRDTREAAAESGAHSRRVSRLRRALPVLALLVLLAVTVWPMLGTKRLSTIVAEAVPNLMVENLKLSGLDADSQPYSLTAARAMQAGGGKNIVDLEKPQGEITLNSGAWLAGKADQGRFDQQNKRLRLDGHVELFHDQGYRFTTGAAQLDMDGNAAWGDQPVLIQGAFGEIRGEGFKVLERGKVVVVTGHAQAILNLPAAGSSDKPKQP
jgi:lipopolysaccharide export system protein LptC